MGDAAVPMAGLDKDLDRKLFLYGTGGYGRRMRRTLADAGLTGIAGFIDTRDGGWELDGLPVLCLDDYVKVRDANDLILVASMHDQEIERELIDRGITDYRLDPYRFYGADLAAMARHAMGDLDGAITAYEEALRLLDHRESWMEAILLHGLAAIQVERGENDRAAALIDRANAVDPRAVTLSLIGYERLEAKGGTVLADALVDLANQRRDAFRAVQQVEEVERCRRLGHIDHPASIIVETLAKCNARCVFCPYTEIPRQGELMPDAMLDKLIAELETFPLDVPLRVVPYGVNEPFLDNRLYDVIARVNERVPHARVTIATNGSTLTAKNIDRLCGLRIDGLNISVNDYRADVYQQLMGLPFDRTLRNLESLHWRARRGELPFPVTLSRAGDNTVHDFRFADWVRRRFPSFGSGIAAMADWLGQVDIPVGAVPSVGCAHWFEMVIRANGDVAFCCADGKTAHPVGNVADKTMLEVYNMPFLRRMRESAVDRRTIRPCDRCTKVE